MDLGVLFYLACILFCGLLFGKLAKFCHLPDVTGYLIGGLIVGPSVAHLIPADTVSQFSLISEMALGFIAFSVGSEFKSSYFKRVGIAPIVIAILEAMGAVLLVTIGLVVFHFDLAFAILLGAIAAATAPAATIMVIRQYKAKGPVTETLLAVVALDDAVALIAFGFAVTIAKSINNAGNTSMLLSILDPILEVVLSFACGAGLGFIYTFLLRFFKSRHNRLIMTIAFVFFATGLANLVDASPLLTCMTLGAVFINFCKLAPDVLKLTDAMTPPLFMMFFVVSGASLQLSVLPTIGLVGVLYVVLRVLGKMGGAWLGATLMKSPPTVRKYLGPTLIPQAGVAIGLSLVAQSVVPEYAAVIRAVVLCGTLIYELVGPLTSKLALQMAGEIAKPEKLPAASAKGRP